VDGRLYCAACAVLPEVDWLGEFKRQCWGRRDPGAWMTGIGGAGGIAVALLYAVTRVIFTWQSLRSGADIEDLARANLPVFLLLLVPGILGVLFAFGVRFARVALLLLPVLVEGLLLAKGSGLESLLVTGFPMLIGLGIFDDDRSRLFFRIDISESRLRKLHASQYDNRLARIGFTMSFLGLLLFPFAPVALALSIAGLQQVDPAARPPIGRTRQAIAGIVLGSLGTILGAALVAWLRR
jgi:hypothetical protein